jgi:hypothetical protein
MYVYVGSIVDHMIIQDFRKIDFCQTFRNVTAVFGSVCSSDVTNTVVALSLNETDVHCWNTDSFQVKFIEVHPVVLDSIA